MKDIMEFKVQYDPEWTLQNRTTEDDGIDVTAVSPALHAQFRVQAEVKRKKPVKASGRTVTVKDREIACP